MRPTHFKLHVGRVAQTVPTCYITCYMTCWNGLLRPKEEGCYCVDGVKTY